jgi:hypothetical protein
MYPISVVVLMVLAPTISILIVLHGSADAPVAALVLRWAVIWMVGARLFVAGVRQVVQPRYTAAAILEFEHTDSLPVIRELGFANLAIGAIGIGSVVWTHWTLPAALAGAIFYGLAGLNHLRSGGRTNFARIAMISDLWASAVLAALLGLNK